MDAKYQQYSEGSSGDYEEDIELRATVNNTIEGDLARAFGASSNFGMSLGVNFEDVALIDGGLYLDPEKGRLKVFSWEEITGFNIPEMLDEGMDVGASEADEVLPKTYGDTRKKYRLIAARVPQSDDLQIESSSIARDYTWHGEDDVEYTDFEDHGGDPIGFGNVVMWFSGNEDYGPSASAKRLASLITQQGDDAVVDENNIYEWLDVPTGENILREDLQDRRVRFFTVRRDSDESERSYNYPVLEDVKTGETIARDHSDESGDSGN